MKTVLQEIIEKLEKVKERCELIDNKEEAQQRFDAYHWTIDYLKTLEEKEQLRDAYLDALGKFEGSVFEQNFEEYYNNTYRKE